MKRFHVHVHVADLAQSIGFYSTMFGAAPARVEADYAKWMLDDPALNFAISTRGAAPGIDHLGLQTEDPAELATLKARAEAAGAALLDEGTTTCCYARSEKHWVTDPTGIAWETFHTLGEVPTFNGEEVAAPAGAAAACCTPEAPAARLAGKIPVKAAAGCCS